MQLILKNMGESKMRFVTLFAALFGLTTIGFSTTGTDATQAAAPAENGVTLLGSLAEWNYPGAKIPQGATMSDGGNPTLQSVKIQAVLTTADSVEDVIAFYEKKLASALTAANPSEASDAPGAAAKSITTQDDSKGRPITIRIFVVNESATSTTLVISRAGDEKETHIAWSQYRRFATRQRSR